MRDDDQRPDREQRVFGVPWDWRRPTPERVLRRTWNAEDPRLFTPTPFGHGHVVNGYWIAHPVEYWRNRMRRGQSRRRA